MGTFWSIYAGFILGILARTLLGKTRSSLLGFIVPVAVGMIGSCAFDFAGQMAGLYGPNQLAAFIAGIIGAALVLAGWVGYDRRKAAMA